MDPGSILLQVAIVAATSAVIWVGSSWLEGASEKLAAYYGLPPVVQGSVVAAVGSSFPELATVAIAGLVADSLSIGVGAIVGSAIFNILVVPAAAGLATADPVEANRTLVYKEAQFYMLSVSVLVITFAFGVIYYPDPDAGDLAGQITRPLAALPLGLYGLYLFIQAQDTAEYVADAERGRHVEVHREWGRLLVGLVVILVAVHLLVEAVDTLGMAAGIDEFLVGVTVLAAATSLPDALVSIRAARDDRSVASLANVLGSNTFDLLVAIPVGVLIVDTWTVDFAMAVPMFGVLTLATVVLFTLLRTDLVLTAREAAVLLVSYGVFVAWVALEALTDVVDYLPAA